MLAEMVLAAVLAVDGGTPCDAPVILPVEAGEPSPLTGRVMDSKTYICVAKRVAGCETERDALRTAEPPWTVLLVVFALGAAAGAYAAVRLSERRPGS